LNRLIDTAVAKGQLVGVKTQSPAEKLVSKANTKERLFGLEQFPQHLYL
jgi:hypothetical protein